MHETILKLLDTEISPQILKRNLIVLSTIIIALKGFCTGAKTIFLKPTTFSQELIYFFLTSGYENTLAILGLFLGYSLMIYTCTLFSELIALPKKPLIEQIQNTYSAMVRQGESYDESGDLEYQLQSNKNYYEDGYIPTQLQTILEQDPYWLKLNKKASKLRVVILFLKSLDLTFTSFKNFFSYFLPICYAIYAILQTTTSMLDLAIKTWPF